MLKFLQATALWLFFLASATGEVSTLAVIETAAVCEPAELSIRLEARVVVFDIVVFDGGVVTGHFALRCVKSG